MRLETRAVLTASRNWFAPMNRCLHADHTQYCPKKHGLLGRQIEWQSVSPMWRCISQGSFSASLLLHGTNLNICFHILVRYILGKSQIAASRFGTPLPFLLSSDSLIKFDLWLLPNKTTESKGPKIQHQNLVILHLGMREL